MTLALYFLGLAAGVALCVRAADWFTDAAVDLAHRLRVPEIIVGATIVSLATTLPEFAVSFVAVLQNEVAVTVGNAIGSTICNIGLILGFCAVIAPIGIARRGFLSGGTGLIALALTFATLGYAFPNGSRWTGLVMITCLVAYFASSVRTSLAHRKATAGAQVVPPKMTVGRTASLFLAGALGVVAGSSVMVSCAVNIAQLMGVPTLVISLTFVAVGTSTPEIVVSVTGVIKKQRALSVGNIIGANILNLAWVMGVCSLVRPLPLERQTLIFDIPVSLLLATLLLVFGLSGQRITRLEGAALFAIYIGYLAVCFTGFGMSAPISR